MYKYGYLLALAGALALSACGGGGNSSFATVGTTSSGGGSSTSSGSTATTYAMGNGSGTTFQNGIINLSSSSLSAGGTASLSVTVVDQSTGTLYTAAPVTVTFNSPCISQGLAIIAATPPSTAGTATDTVATTSGNATATYTAKGCSPNDVITATAVVDNENLTAAATITVAAATVGSIQFVSATPTTIGLKGTGLTETSTVIFKVVDATGGARPGVAVGFNLDTTVGGMSLSPITATSAADGTVQTVVSSGTVHTSVRVTATIASPSLSTESSALTVTTGLPASAGFSIAVGAPSYAASGLACPNVEAYGTDGVTVPITVRLSDRYNNPVPDGTAIVFNTDGGHIVGSCTTPSAPTSPGDGTCSATWTSANPRPQLAEDSPALLAAGRARILATAIGEESFTDVNGSGFWQTGDPFVNLGEPYRDDNENGQYDHGEYFLDYNQNGVWDAGSGSFVGITCTGTTAGSTCTTAELAIGAQQLLIMSTSAATITVTGTSGFGGTVGGGLTLAPSVSGGASSTGSITFNVKDLNTNPMPAGTTIAVIADSAIGTISGTGAAFTIGCRTAVGGDTLSVTLTAATTAGASGNITIQVTTPGTKTLTELAIPVTL